jgi:hypothetical protein
MRGAEKDLSTAHRFERELEVSGSLFRVVAVWRGEESGYGILYFFKARADDGSTDRRALLMPDTEPDRLDDSRLMELFEGGRALTDTEKRFTAPDGRQWLAQNRGPVWAGRAAEGHSGIRFTSLEGERETIIAAAGHLGEMPTAELEARWREASQAARPAEREPDAGEPR